MASEPVSQYQPFMAGQMNPMPNTPYQMPATMGGVMPPAQMPPQPQQQFTQQQQQQMQQQMMLQQQMQQGGDVASSLNNQFAQEVPPDSYVNPDMMRTDNKGRELESKIPQMVKDPIAIFVIIILVTYPAVKKMISKYVTQVGDNNSLVGIGFLAALVAVLFGLYKKFIVF